MLNPLFTTYPGELAALSAAMIWAIASLVYARLGKQLSPLVLNIVKGSISIGLILLTLGLQGELAVPQALRPVLLLALSGAIGIGIGDTAFFESLNCLGARRGLLMESLAPPLTALLALVWLQEQLSASAWIGIGLTVLGVAWVVVERTPDGQAGPLRPARGIACGLVAAGGQAIGAVLSRAALVDSSVTPLWSTLIRLVAGLLVLLMGLMAQRQSAQELQLLRSPRFAAVLVGTAFAGTYLGIWLQQIALKLTAAGIAQSLAATSPLFVIPIAAWMGDRVSLRAVLGVLVALGGIWLLFGHR